MKIIFTTIVLFVFTSIANATLIDATPSNTSFTTINNLDWLDWSTTNGLSGDDALTANAGWRFATSAEASALMDTAFGALTYDGSGLSRQGNAYQSVYDAFASLFGVTCPSCRVSGVYAQVSGYGLIGARDLMNDGGVYAFNGYAPSTYDAVNALQNFGIALVRNTTSVSAPTGIVLLSLSLCCLLLSRRSK